jgi:isopenicillin N synthase-like dioxygenase
LRLEYFAELERFFKLPLERKLAVRQLPSGPFRGYFPPRAENNDPGRSIDIKEGFDAMADPIGSQTGPFWQSNRWPRDVAGLEAASTAYFEALTALAHRLMGAIAVSLDLTADYFEDKLDPTFAILRGLHYPPSAGSEQSDEIGTGAHTDYGLITILAQDDTGGLQIRTDDGWIDVPPIADAFVINIADGLQRWTNDLFRSSVHRVIDVAGGDRYSAPFFFHAAEDTIIDCLPGCAGESRPARHQPIASGAYLHERYGATFTTF